MEAYFHDDPRIEAWVDEITEKLFTVCLLTGADSEVEFQNGCQIVSKITNILQGISIFPSEYLEDGLKQLLEQQLPDSRVINNFPTFQETMKNMISEGMRQALDTQNQENLATIDISKKDTFVKTEVDAVKSSEDCCAENTEPSVNDHKSDFVIEEVIAALATVVTSTPETKNKTTNLLEAGVGLQAFALAARMPILKDSSSLIGSTIVPSTVLPSPGLPSTFVDSTVVPPSLNKTYGILRKSQVPEHADRLKRVLINFFPNAPICWNFNLKGKQFLAQVEDILIWLENPEQSCSVENLNKEGWKVYECSSTDLMFPRRLERGIRQIQRLGTKCRNV